MPDIFLSYSRDDQAIARKFAEGFERVGFSVWWDATLNPGEAYDQVTEKALLEAKAVVVLWSKKSVDSRWVRAEATQALDSKTLVPVMIEVCKRPIMFELTHTADLSQWTGDRNDKAWQAYVAGVRRFVEKGEAGSAAATNATPPTAAPARSGSKLGLRISIAVAIALLVLLAGRDLQRSLFPSGEEQSATQSSATTAQDISLAVLPFTDLSPAHDQENFSDGLTEEILNQLAQIKHLTVTGRTSSFLFKGKNEDLRVIGEKLGVANLLEGSIRKDGNQLRITAQLISSSNGAHLWSHTYDRELSGIFALQEEIARDVALALSVKLDVGDMRRAEGGTTNIEAYERFLRAEALDGKLSMAALQQQVQLLREAIALDSGFVRAWYGLQAALEGLVVNPDPRTASATRNEMADIRARVAAMAPDEWWTQAMLAEQFRAQHQWAEAERADSRAMATAPPGKHSVAITHTLLLWATGRMQEAAAYMQRAHPANPLSIEGTMFLLLSLGGNGQQDEALAAYRRINDSGVTSIQLDMAALSLIWSRHDATPEEIRAQWRVVLKSPDVVGQFNVSIGEHFEDKVFVRSAIRQRFEDSVNGNRPPPPNILVYADHFGEKDLVLASLRRRLIDLNGLTLNELWMTSETGFRSDPRFKDILRELGLADYFRSTGKWGDFCKPVGTDDFECH